MSTDDPIEDACGTTANLEESASVMAEKAMRENREHMKQVLIRAKNDLLASLANNQFLTEGLFDAPVEPDNSSSEREASASRPIALPEIPSEDISQQKKTEGPESVGKTSPDNLDDLEALPGLTWNRLRFEGSESLEKYQQASEQAINEFNNKVQTLAHKTFSSITNIQAVAADRTTPVMREPEELMKDIITSVNEPKGD